MGDASDSIIRAQKDSGKNQIVMIYATEIVEHSLQTEICSGTYIAPRVVLTAAHCLQNVFDNQVFVYFGDDFATEFAELVPNGSDLIPPAPGTPSHWSKADSFETHPDYDANLNHPDLAVIYLDRALPFDPLPVARFRLDDSYIGKKMDIIGWGASHVTGPVSADNAEIERTGSSRFLGTPKASDYHPEDPNPGILDAHVRRDLFKLDGHAPNSNMCFGDSGGAMLVSDHGKNALGGVFFWTGLSCEDYSMFTRLDPFLPYLDKAANRGGSAKLALDFDCVAPNPSGTLTAYFGYDNKNGVGLDIPKGPKNYFPLDTHNFRPTHFDPGSHDFVFGVDFKQNQTLVYSIDPANNPRSTVVVDKHSKACGAKQAPQVECGNTCRAEELSGCAAVPSFAQCMSDCISNNTYVNTNNPECTAFQTAWDQCIASQAPGGDNWSCYDDGSYVPDANNCIDPQLINLYGCLGYL